MAFHSLRIPDLPAWLAYPRYSPRVAQALSASYHYLFADPNDMRGYLAALRQVELVQHLPMCLPQRIRISYVKSMIYRKLTENELCLDASDDSFEIAVTLGDLASQRDALTIRGVTLRRVVLFGQAAEDYQRALLLHRRIRELGGEADLRIDLELLAQLVSYETDTAHYDAATAAADEARAVAAEIPGLTDTNQGKLLLASLDLGEAQLLRWRGQHDLARVSSSRAAAVFAKSGSAINAGRVHILLSDCMLDLIERAPMGSERNTRIREAHQIFQRARDLAYEGNDRIGIWMLGLRLARFSRLIGSNDDRAGAIEEVANLAQRAGDEATLSEAFTGLGDELAARGEIESALNRYREAIAVLDGSEALAWKAAPLRALHQWYEQHPSSRD